MGPRLKYLEAIVVVVLSLLVGLATKDAGWAIFCIIALEIMALKVGTTQMVEVVKTPTVEVLRKRVLNGPEESRSDQGSDS